MPPCECICAQSSASSSGPGALSECLWRVAGGCRQRTKLWKQSWARQNRVKCTKGILTLRSLESSGLHPPVTGKRCSLARAQVRTLSSPLLGSLSLSLSIACSLSPSFSFALAPLSLSRALSLCRSLSLAPSLSRSLVLSRSLALSLSLRLEMHGLSSPSPESLSRRASRAA